MTRAFRTTLATGAAALLVVACSEHSAVAPDLEASFAKVIGTSPPPPPPVDTMAATIEEGSSSGPSYFGVTMMMNRTGNNTWLAFDGDGASPNARLQLRGNGTVKGNGTLMIGSEVLSLGDATGVNSNTLGPCETPGGGGEIIVQDETRFPGAGRCGDVSIQFGDRSFRFAIGVDTPVAQDR